MTDSTRDDTPETRSGEAGDADGDTSRTVPAGAFVIVVMVAMALGVLAVVALTTAGSGGENDELRTARTTAGRFSERFLTFEHDALDEWKADVLASSTGGFAEEVEEVEAGLRRLIDEAELDAQAQVTDIFIGEIANGSVSAVVVYDRELVTADGTRTERDRYMQLRLLRVDGEWLVDNVLDIATAGATPPSPATTTTVVG